MKSSDVGAGPISVSRSKINTDLYLYWTETWNKAVAEAWRDPGFAEALVANPKKALLDKFGFVFHDSINLTVVQTEPGAKDPAGEPYGWTPGGSGGDSWNLVPTDVTIHLPAAPAAEEQGVAVMAYWETDAALPFSCACC